MAQMNKETENVDEITFRGFLDGMERQLELYSEMLDLSRRRESAVSSGRLSEIPDLSRRIENISADLEALNQNMLEFRSKHRLEDGFPPAVEAEAERISGELRGCVAKLIEMERGYLEIGKEKLGGMFEKAKRRNAGRKIVSAYGKASRNAQPRFFDRQK